MPCEVILNQIKGYFSIQNEQVGCPRQDRDWLRALGQNWGCCNISGRKDFTVNIPKCAVERKLMRTTTGGKTQPTQQLWCSCVADTLKMELKWKYLSLYLSNRWYPKFNPDKSEWGFVLGHWFMICAEQAWGSLTELPKGPRHKPHIVITVKIKPSCDPRTLLMKDKEFGQSQWFSDGPFPSNNSFIFHQAAPSSPQQLNSTGIFACWGFAGVSLTTDKACSVMKLSDIKWIEQRALIWANYSQPLETHGCGKVRQCFPLENRKLMPYITSFLLDPTAQGSFLFYCDTI